MLWWTRGSNKHLGNCHMSWLWSQSVSPWPLLKWPKLWKQYIQMHFIKCISSKENLNVMIQFMWVSVNFHILIHVDHPWHTSLTHICVILDDNVFLIGTKQLPNTNGAKRPLMLRVKNKNMIAMKMYAISVPELDIIKKGQVTMMTLSNGNIFRVTGYLCGEFTGYRWIPRTKGRDAELWCFLWSAPD